MGKSYKYKINKLFVLIIIAGLFSQLTMLGMEPYPLIVFPGGGKVIENTNKLSYSNYQYIAYSHLGEKTEADQYKLFNTIPNSYINSVSRHLYRLPTTKKFSEATKRQGKKWLRKKLIDITNFDTISKLEIRSIVSNIYLKNNNIDSIGIQKTQTLSTIKF